MTHAARTTMAFQGRYMLRVVRPDGTERCTPWFDNLILDNGLNGMGAGTIGPLAWCAVGTGTTAPANAQTSLVASVASTNDRTAVQNGNDVTNGYYWVRVTYRFAQGAAAGNLTEVGVGFSGSNLFSRALILDGSGAPTVIPVLADEFLDVIYELRAYWPTTDVTGTLNIGGTNYNYTLRASDVGTWNNLQLLTGFGFIDPNYVPQMTAYTGGTLGAIDQPPGGSTLGTVNGSWAGSYSNNSYQRALTATLTTAINAAFDKLQVTTSYQGKWKLSFSPAVPKNGANTFTLSAVLTWTRRSI